MEQGADGPMACPADGHRPNVADCDKMGSDNTNSPPQVSVPSAQSSNIRRMTRLQQASRPP